MRIAVFGGTGRTGRPLIKKLIEAGHVVHALTRSPRKFGLFAAGQLDNTQVANLKVVQGDIQDPQAVAETMQTTEAVIVVVGHADPFPWAGSKTASNMQTIGMQNILAASPPRRIIMLTGSGVRFPGDHPGIIDKSVNWLLSKLAADRINDGERAARLLSETDLDWTILRAFLLTENLPRDRYQTGRVGDYKMGYMIDRVDVAQLITDILQDEAYYQTAPYISW